MTNILTFEYKVESFSSNGLYSLATQMENELNQLAPDGWEVVNIATCGTHTGGHMQGLIITTIFLTLRRPLAATPEND